MTQFSTLFTRFLDQELGTDDSTVLFTTARRKSVINDGQKEFADLTECLVRESTIAVTGGTAEYDLNSTATIPNGDFSRVTVQGPTFVYADASSNVTYLAGDDFPRRDIVWLDRYEPGWRESSVTSSVQQMPRYWYLRPDGARLWFGMVPTPCTGSSATAKVLVPYVLYPDPLTSDTQHPFAVTSAQNARLDLRAYHKALAHYGAHDLEKLRRDDMASDRQLQKFMGYVSRYLQAMRRKGGLTLTYARSYFKRKTDVSDPRT
jgi:hypothetical protein